MPKFLSRRSRFLLLVASLKDLLSKGTTKIWVGVIDFGRKASSSSSTSLTFGVMSPRLSDPKLSFLVRRLGRNAFLGFTYLNFLLKQINRYWHSIFIYLIFGINLVLQKFFLLNIYLFVNLRLSDAEGTMLFVTFFSIGVTTTRMLGEEDGLSSSLSSSKAGKELTEYKFIDLLLLFFDCKLASNWPNFDKSSSYFLLGQADWIKGLIGFGSLGVFLQLLGRTNFLGG